MSLGKITFYTNKLCPFAQRAAIALKESGAEYERVEIDLLNKPSWYKDVNPDLKVPALNTEGQSIAESLVIIEYISDRFPEKNLMPKEPLKRANVRFAIDFFGNKIAPQIFKYAANKEESAVETFKENVNDALKRFNELLLQESPSGPYFLGEQFSLADVGIASFALRLYAVARFIDKDFEFEQVNSSPRLAEFFKGVTSRPSVQETYCGDAAYIQIMQEKFGLSKH